MSRIERLARMEQMFAGGRVVPRDQLLQKLEISLATLKRDLEYLRSRLNRPIVWDADAGGYRIDSTQTSGAQYEIPGLWFSDKEIHALLTMHHLLANLDPGGILASHIEPLMERLNKLLGAAKNPADEVRRRVLIVGIGKRAMKLAHFEKIGSALLRRRRLRLTYFSRGKAEETEREISPQRLVHYRENWYLDAWCHLRGGLRNFAVDSIRHVDLIDRPAKELAEKTLNTILGPGYGIFAGNKLQWAKLRFSPERARWVASEHWHPDQRGRFEADGSYVLEVPYADHRELMMDVLKHGGHCEVLGPVGLREIVAGEAREIMIHYAAGR